MLVARIDHGVEIEIGTILFGNLFCIFDIIAPDVFRTLKNLKVDAVFRLESFAEFLSSCIGYITCNRKLNSSDVSFTWSRWQSLLSVFPRLQMVWIQFVSKYVVDSEPILPQVLFSNHKQSLRHWLGGDLVIDVAKIEEKMIERPYSSMNCLKGPSILYFGRFENCIDHENI